MAGAAQQAGARRAWGAPPPPKPAPEQRREVVAADPAHAAQQQHAAPEPHHRVSPFSMRRSRAGKHALPRLNAAAASPRGAPVAHPPAKQLLYGSQPGQAKEQQHGLDAEAMTIPAQHATPFEPPLLPSASPEGLPGAQAEEQEEEEEDDLVLMGSAAPSFSVPAAPASSRQQPAGAAQAGEPSLQPQQQQQVLPSAGEQAGQAAAAPSPQQQQQQQQRPSSLDSRDLSLSALAAASRRCTRYTSATGSAQPECQPSAADSMGGGEGQEGAGALSQGSEGGGAPAALPVGPPAAPLGSGGSSAQQPAHASSSTGLCRLSSGELAVLRQSLIELQLGGQQAGTAAAGADGSSSSRSGQTADIPDQLVLRELSSRLGRLDSQKRRVLLAVLAKIDAMPGGGCEDGCEAVAAGAGQLTSRGGDGDVPGAEAAAAAGEGQADARASQLLEDCRQESARGSESGAAAVPLVHDSGVGSEQQQAHTQAAAARGSQLEGAQAGQQHGQQPAEAPLPAGAALADAPLPAPPSPTKNIASKLAALRQGRAASQSPTSPSNAHASSQEGLTAGGSVEPALQHSPPLVQAQAAQQQQAGAAGHAHGSSKLQSMVQARHRERSRLSGDGARPARAVAAALAQHASRLSPAAAATELAGMDALAALATEHSNPPQPQPVAAAGAAVAGQDHAVLRFSVEVPARDSLVGRIGDSLELLARPSSLLPAQLDAAAAGAAAAPLSARNVLGRTSTLPVLAQAGGAGSRAPPAAGRSASPDAAAANGGALQEAASRGGAGSRASAGSGPGLVHSQELVLVLVDTWGDSHFCGLAGLQLLGPTGQPIPLGAEQLAADPPDLNCFPGHSGDVRTVDKLADGINNTQDDAHMWLAPVRRQLSPAAAATASQRRSPGFGWSALPEEAAPFNLLAVQLPPGGAALSGLRVWNYNKSVQDTSRGVKRMVVLADGVEVSPPGGFLVRRAPGRADIPFGQLIPLSPCWAAVAAGASGVGLSRRITVQAAGGRQGLAAGKLHGLQGPGLGQGRQQQHNQQQQLSLGWADESVAWVCNHPDPAAALECLQRAALLAKAAGPGGGLVAQPGENFATVLPCGFCLRLALVGSWGDPHYVGLSGLEVVDAVRGPIRVRPDQVSAVPASVAQLPGMADDVRTPDKLVDGNCSGEPQHSWLAPLDPHGGNSVLITLDAPVLLGALRVWNYARTPSRGVQQLEVYLDEQLVWKGLLQRAPAEPAPGQDFAQALCFSEEAMAEASATTRRRAAATARRPGRAAGGIGGGGAGALPALPGDPLGVEGVEEWCQAQERVVLVNEGHFVAFPPDGARPAASRPVTSVVAC